MPGFLFGSLSPLQPSQLFRNPNTNKSVTTLLLATSLLLILTRNKVPPTSRNSTPSSKKLSPSKPKPRLRPPLNLKALLVKPQALRRSKTLNLKPQLILTPPCLASRLPRRTIRHIFAPTTAKVGMLAQDAIFAHVSSLPNLPYQSKPQMVALLLTGPGSIHTLASS